MAWRYCVYAGCCYGIEPGRSNKLKLLCDYSIHTPPQRRQTGHCRFPNSLALFQFRYTVIQILPESGKLTSKIPAGAFSIGIWATLKSTRI